MKNGAQLINEERERQMVEEGWTAQNDDLQDNCEMTAAAVCYVNEAAQIALNGHCQGDFPNEWPEEWDAKWWKPSTDPIRNLVKAGALIAAEIDRLQRAGSK